MQRIFKQSHRKIGGILICVLLAVSMSFSPLPSTSHTPLSHIINQTGGVVGVRTVAAFGGGPVTVIGGTGTVQETLTASSNAVISGLQDALYVKEFSLDPIAYALAKMILQSMTQSIVNWINSGFQGSPAFVTDLKQFLLDQADAIAGDYIYNDPSLNFLCSPFQLDVKIALATSYQQEAHEGVSSQCTLTGVEENIESFLNGDSFSPQNWFEVTQNPVNTPTGAYLATKGEMMARIADAEGNTINELEWGQGFLSFKVCSDTDVTSGAQTNCQITTPGQVIADQINKSLGAGQDTLIAADEINEIIGALFAQLAQQAITGINGLLGLSSGGFTGSDGTQYDSYLEAVGAESTTAGTIQNPLEPAVNREQENIALQNTIIQKIDDVNGKLNAAKAQYPQCLNLSLPSELTTARADARTAINTSNGVLPVLISLRDTFASSTDPQEMSDIIETYNQLQTAGLVTDITANNVLQVYIDFDLTDTITALETDIDTRKRQCANNND